LKRIFTKKGNTREDESQNKEEFDAGRSLRFDVVNR